MGGVLKVFAMAFIHLFAHQLLSSAQRFIVTIKNITSSLPSKLLEEYVSLTNLCLQKNRTLSLKRKRNRLKTFPFSIHSKPLHFIFLYTMQNISQLSTDI